MTDNQENANVILYDIDKRDYPRNHGEVFRTIQIYECAVCGFRTNKAAYIRTYFGARVPISCDYSWECWHHELEKRVKRINWEFKDPEMARAKIDQYRNMAIKSAEKEFVDDIQGDASSTIVRPMPIIFTTKLGIDCPHNPIGKLF